MVKIFVSIRHDISIHGSKFQHPGNLLHLKLSFLWDVSLDFCFFASSNARKYRRADFFFLTDL